MTMLQTNVATLPHCLTVIIVVAQKFEQWGKNLWKPLK